MSAPDVLVVGEALVDVVTLADGSERRHPGGSAANVAVALARLGRSVGLLTCLGRDEPGRFLAAHLAGTGVGLVGDPWALGRTSSATAALGAEGSATYRFDVEWAPQPMSATARQAVHVGSIGAVLEPGATVVRNLVRDLARSEAGGPVLSYDVNARTAITGVGAPVLARVEELVALADVVKVSDEDLADLWPGLDVDTALSHLLDLGAGAVVLTSGAAGASWHDRAGMVEVAAVPTDVIDTIAAGDTFMAALLDTLLDRNRPWRRSDVRRALERAAAAAAVTVSRAGADPPTATELSQVPFGRR